MSNKGRNRQSMYKPNVYVRSSSPATAPSTTNPDCKSTSKSCPTQFPDATARPATVGARPTRASARPGAPDAPTVPTSPAQMGAARCMTRRRSSWTVGGSFSGHEGSSASSSRVPSSRLCQQSLRAPLYSCQGGARPGRARPRTCEAGRYIRPIARRLSTSLL